MGSKGRPAVNLHPIELELLGNERRRDAEAAAAAARLAKVGLPCHHLPASGPVATVSAALVAAGALADAGSRWDRRRTEALHALVVEVAAALADAGIDTRLPPPAPDEPPVVALRRLARTAERSATCHVALEPARAAVVEALLRRLGPSDLPVTPGAPRRRWAAVVAGLKARRRRPPALGVRSAPRCC